MKGASGIKKTRRYLRYTILLILGGIAGGVLFLIMFTYQIEELMLENRNLYLLTDRLQRDIKGMQDNKKNTRQRQQWIIEEIEITFLEPRPNKFLEADIKQAMIKDLSNLKGKKGEQMTEVQDLIHQMLERREYIIDGKVVEVRIKTLAIYHVLHLFVTVKEQPQTIGLES
ncbi:hypothetical protein [Brevibacillus daliensis]|uniref:hypothetical protein n=1 Tax=Brevibacillus daliensis TaxID=2892995 RepID=UPI001E3B553B|nr:hypothetical protein [Brevibacillus daliensis]